MIKPILTYAHQLLSDSIDEGDLVIDGTCGNGHDTVFLADLVGNNGKVLAFDIQQQAIENTMKRIDEFNYRNVSVIHDGHENVKKYIEKDDVISGAIFNLGYLPGSDKTIITEGNSTITAVEAILNQLKKNGIVVLVVYYGHIGGEEEKKALLQYVEQLDQSFYQVLRYELINQVNKPPFIIAIEKKKLQSSKDKI